MMAAHLFNSNGQMHEVDIPDIFDVLEGGEDESAVKFLLGFSADDGLEGEQQQFVVDSTPSQNLDISSLQSSMLSESNSSNDDSAYSQDRLLTKEGKPRKRDPVDPSRCIYNCDNCDKAFTTKFNLKRHINLHCNKSKEAGVPIQGPPSASMPSRKARERREAMAAAGMEFVTPSATKKSRKSSKASKTKNLKRNLKSPAAAQQVVQVLTATTKNNVTLVKPTPSTTTTSKASVALPSTVTYQVSGQQQTVSFQINNSNQQQQPKIQHPTIVRIAAPAQQQQLKIMRPQQQQPVLPMQPLPESSLQMIQIAHQTQQKQQPQFVQQRIVRVVQQNNQQQFPRQATIVGHIQGSNGTNIPILQQNGAQGVLQAIPISFLPAAAKAIVTRAIHLPQQPLPIIHTIQSSSSQVKPIQSSGQQLPVMAAGISSIMPKFAATAVHAHQRVTEQQQQQQQQHSNVKVQIRPSNVSLQGATISASILSTSFLPTTCSSMMRNQIENELSCPPDEIFDSEDEDASSVATTTEAPSPTSMIGDDVKDFLSGHFIDDDMGIVEKQEKKNNNDDSMDTTVETSSSVNVVVTSTSDNLLDLNDYLDNDNPDDNPSALNLPLNPRREELQEIPRGWLRKIIPTSSGQQKVFYYNTSGKKFSCQDEIEQYFGRLGQTVRPGLFNFEPPTLVEDEDEDEDDEEMSELEAIAEKSVCSSTTSTLQQLQPCIRNSPGYVCVFNR